MQGKKVLVIEDDPLIRDMVTLAFSREGAVASAAADGRAGLQRFFAERPDLVILDIMMPGLSGWDLCRQLHQVAPATPIIIVTAVQHEDAIVRGLDMGASDYVTKPFSPKVLLARARAVLRQGQDPDARRAAPPFEDDHLHVDLDGFRVLAAGQPVHLTKTEFAVLAVLLRNRGRVVTFDQILGRVWGPGYEGNDAYVHVYTSRLRKKLEPDPDNPRYIISEQQIGYRFMG